MRQLPHKTIMGLLWTVAAVGVCSQAWAQDARAVLTQTLRAYQKLTSYEGKTSVDATLVTQDGRKRPIAAQSSQLLFKRPNKFMVKVNSSKMNVEIYGDGTHLTVFKADAMRYFSQPSPADMTGILAVLHNRAEVDAVLDPLFFLSSPTLPTTLGSLKMGNSARVNGHDVVKVTGVWIGKPLVITGRTNPFCSQGAQWTLYIDKNSALLQKIEARVATKINVAVKNKGKIEAVPMAVTMIMQHVVVEAKPNAPLDESVFTFTPPTGAKEQKDVNELLKNNADGAHSF